MLEDAGIQTYLRNADGSNMAGVMIFDVYPALCVVNDSDVEQANALLSRIAVPVTFKADRVDKPWLVIWCSIALFGPLIVAGLVGIIWSIFAQGDVSEPVAAITDDIPHPVVVCCHDTGWSRDGDQGERMQYRYRHGVCGIWQRLR